MDDLCIICPSGYWKAFIEALLDRPRHLGIREITYRVLVLNDGQQEMMLREGSDFANRLRGRFNHSVMLLDGDRVSEDTSGNALEKRLRAELEPIWQSDAAVVVAEPALESWLLEGHRAFARIGQLKGVDVRKWFSDEGIWPKETDTPDQPRHAVEALFREFGVAFSAANYRLVARDFPIRFDRIESASFRRFILTLRNWFLP